MKTAARPKLILGTVQLGIPYGYEKGSYTVDAKRAHAILDEAYELGVKDLDAALGYGQSHAFIGEFHRSRPGKRFGVYSKARASDRPEGSSVTEAIVRELAIDRLEGLFLHEAKDMKNDAFMASLRADRSSGLLGALGVSLYHDEEPQPAREHGFEIAQIAFNPLDHARTRETELGRLKNELGMRLFCRSAFLRGAVFQDFRKITPPGLHPAFVRLTEIAAQESMSLPALCLNYCMQAPVLDHVIVGVDHPGQLTEIRRWTERPLTREGVSAIEAIRITDTRLLNLRNWPQ